MELNVFINKLETFVAKILFQDGMLIEMHNT